MECGFPGATAICRLFVAKTLGSPTRSATLSMDRFVGRGKHVGGGALLELGDQFLAAGER